MHAMCYMEAERLKKIITISYYFNLRDTDRAFTVYNYFTDRGFDVTSFVGDFDHNSKKHVKYNMKNVNEVHVKAYKKNVSFARIFSHIKFGYDVKKILHKSDFDVAYIVGPPNSTGYILKKIVKNKNALLVSDIYDLYPETIPIPPKAKKILKYAGFWFWAYLRNATIKSSDLFIGSCHYYFTYLGLKDDEKHHMIPLCKGEAQIDVVNKKNCDVLHIVYLGALTGNYDFEGLVELMIALKKLNRRAHLDIIGEGDRRKWLLNCLTAVDIQYKFHGRIYDDEIKKRIMANAHFGFNGFKENATIALSYKSMEYMSNGLALINSCKEDTWDLVANEHIGINYKTDSTTDLAASLSKLSSGDIFNMQTNSLKVYTNNFAHHVYVKKMDELFLEQKVNGE